MIIKSNYKHVKDRRVKNKERAVELLGGKCIICGYNKCIRALEFHHLEAKNKEFSISANLNKAWSKIEDELKKCVLVCANCHREVETGIAFL